MSKRAVAFGFCGFALTLLCARAPSARADVDPDPNQVVARIGSATITVGELERRLARLPAFQLATYGQNAQEVRRAMLDKVLIPEYLMAQGAMARGLNQDADVRARQRDALRAAILRDLREHGGIGPITDAEVAGYFAAHRAQYDSPARFAIWRILVASRQEAQQLISEAKKDPTPKTWNELARTRSLDRSNNLRGGNLGFVSETGDSTDAKVRVEAAVIDAVKGVKDGEFVDHPVPEGSGFAVLWRRGSTPAIHRSVVEEQDAIKKILARDKSMAAQEKLVASLRAKDLSGFNPSGVDLLDVSSSGQLAPHGKPGRVDRRVSSGLMGPETTPRGPR
jgi:peptidyl-prolyl cis-trans isomerase C